MKGLSIEQIKRVAISYRAGESVDKISEDIPCSVQSVRGAIRRLRLLGVPLPAKSSSAELIALSKELGGHGNPPPIVAKPRKKKEK